MITLLIAFAMIAVLSTGVWYYLEYTQTQQMGSRTEVPVLGPTVTIAPPEAQTPDGWVEFTDETAGISFLHPQDAQIKRENEYVGVIMLGPTQSEGTELYDGLAVLLSTYPLNGKGLRAAAEADRETTASDPVVQVGEITPITYAGQMGYTYQASSLGTRSIIILPFENDLYLKVINSTVDPTGKGFEQTTEQIVSSVRS